MTTFTEPRQSLLAQLDGQGLSRRHFLGYGAALASLGCPHLNALPRSGPVRFASYPFTLGVASGDPDETSVVLWTRLAPAPLEPHGGMPNHTVRGTYEVAHDEGMKHIVASGPCIAPVQLGHTVHALAHGLTPDRFYFYRFRFGDAHSPVGRTRTLPAPGAHKQHMRFAVTSCQNYEQGLFTAYEAMAREDLDLVFHLGDYIYEYAAGKTGRVRLHLGQELESLEDYRRRYAQYRLDPLLQQMHARCPWFVTWDDHEFDNNCAGDVSEEPGIDPVQFLKRRANAYQAYYEVMPLRIRSLPRGPHMQLYRKTAFGDLAEFFVLDTRQYRSDQPNGDGKDPINAAALNPQNTLLGKPQKHWLEASLLASRGSWNVLAQQVMMAMVSIPRPMGVPVSYMDQWPGYAAERMDLMRFLEDRRIPGPVVLTGDIHSHWANDLRVDDRKHDDKIVASEFVTTSLASGGDGVDKPLGLSVLKGMNPFVASTTSSAGTCAVHSRTTFGRPTSWSWTRSRNPEERSPSAQPTSPSRGNRGCRRHEFVTMERDGVCTPWTVS